MSRFGSLYAAQEREGAVGQLRVDRKAAEIAQPPIDPEIAREAAAHVGRIELLRETGRLTPRGIIPWPERERGGPAGTADRVIGDIRLASLPREAVAPFVMRSPEISRQVLEVVIGGDDRLQISPTSDRPWRWICMLSIIAADGSLWVGTGWLAGPRVVVTAGHVVYIRNRGGWVSHIEVVAGADGASRPYGSAVATRFRSVAGWVEDSAPEFDYGAILLPVDAPFGFDLGFFGYASPDDNQIVGTQTSLSGYPSDKPFGTQWHHARELLRVEPRLVYYNIDTVGGQSGSPVWTNINGRRYSIGIHTGGLVTGNSAVRITTGVYDNLALWNREA